MGKVSHLESARQAFYNHMIGPARAAAYTYSNLSYKEQKRLISLVPSNFQRYLYIQSALPHSYNEIFSKVCFVSDNLLSGLGCMVMQLLLYRKEIDMYVKL